MITCACFKSLLWVIKQMLRASFLRSPKKYKDTVIIIQNHIFYSFVN